MRQSAAKLNVSLIKRLEMNSKLRNQLDAVKTQLQLLSKILPLADLLDDEALIERAEICREQLAEAEEDEQFCASIWQLYHSA